jgi:glutathione S-transferase
VLQQALRDFERYWLAGDDLTDWKIMRCCCCCCIPCLQVLQQALKDFERYWLAEGAPLTGRLCAAAAAAAACSILQVLQQALRDFERYWLAKDDITDW